MIIRYASNTSDANSTQRRIGTFSEQYYADGPFADIIDFNFRRLCQYRAGMLPRGTSVIGQRYQQVEPLGASAVRNAFYPGSADLAQDVPQIALHFRVKGVAVANVRSVDLRGIPDARVIEGEYSPSNAYTNAINGFFLTLGGAPPSRLEQFTAIPFLFRGRDLSQTAWPLVNITSGGVYTTIGNSSFVKGDKVQVIRATDDDGDRRVGGFFTVGDGPTATSGTLIGYNLGATTKGSIRKAITIFPQFPAAAPDMPIVIQKKVGRDTRSYRGRRSVRR